MKTIRSGLVTGGLLLMTFDSGVGQSAVGAAHATRSIPRLDDRSPPFHSTTNGSKVCGVISYDGKLMISTNGVRWTEMDAVNNFLRTFFRDATYGNGIFAVVGGSYVHVPSVIVTSKDGKVWTFRDSGTRNNLYSVTFGNGRFVAVGDHDTILTSKNAVHWRKRNSMTSEVLFASVAFGNGIFVAVGDSGTIRTSSDGVRWQPRISGTSMYLSKVGYEKGRFVITAANGVTLVSTDGLAWALRSSPHDFAATVSVDSMKSGVR